VTESVSSTFWLGRVTMQLGEGRSLWGPSRIDAGFSARAENRHHPARAAHRPNLSEWSPAGQESPNRSAAHHSPLETLIALELSVEKLGQDRAC
jgi:hypothetical protein